MNFVFGRDDVIRRAVDPSAVLVAFPNSTSSLRGSYTTTLHGSLYSSRARSIRRFAILGPRVPKAKRTIDMIKPAVSMLSAGLAALLLVASIKEGLADAVSVATVTIYGKIQQQDVAALEHSLANNKVGEVRLISKGGDPYAAMAIGRLIRENQTRVWVLQYCFASCALIYIAGVNRLNAGKIELYRPDLMTDTTTGSGSTSAVDPKLASDVRAYVAEMGVSDKFTNLMLDADPKNIAVFDIKNITLLVPRDDSTFIAAQQVRFARGFGITADEYRRRLREAQTPCGPVEQLNWKCSAPIMWGLDPKSYETRSKQADTVCSPEQKEYVEKVPYLELPYNKLWWDDPAVLKNENCRVRVMKGL